MDNTKLEVLSEILSLIKSENYSATITNIATDCCLPVAYTRKAILALLKNSLFSSYLETPDHNSNSSGYDTLAEKYQDFPDKTANEILNGVHDDVEWNFILGFLKSYDDELVHLTKPEHDIIKSKYPNLINTDSAFIIKTSIPPLSKDIIALKQDLIDAQLSHDRVSFDYAAMDRSHIRVECYPYEISANVSENKPYMLSTSGVIYRLDRIKNLTIHRNTSKDYLEPAEDAHRKYLWGASANYGDDIIHVKFCVKPDSDRSLPKNLIPKIQNDLKRRSETCKYYIVGDIHYFEDDIIGIYDFHRWVRSYGSSITILEPAELGRKIVGNAKKTLELYEMAEKWRDL